MSRTLLVRLFALLVPLAAACSEDPVSTPLPPEARIDTTTFAPSLGIDLSKFTVTESGLYVQDRQPGTGELAAAVGDTLLVHYIGWFPNGRVFEQTSPDFPPFKFVLGGGTIAGWREGVAGMRVGGSRLLIVPPSLGYGYAGNRNALGELVIPGNQVLVFRIDLYSIKRPATTETGT